MKYKNINNELIQIFLNIQGIEEKLIQKELEEINSDPKLYQIFNKINDIEFFKEYTLKGIIDTIKSNRYRIITGTVEEIGRDYLRDFYKLDYFVEQFIDFEAAGQSYLSGFNYYKLIDGYMILEF